MLHDLCDTTCVYRDASSPLLSSQGQAVPLGRAPTPLEFSLLLQLQFVHARSGANLGIDCQTVDMLGDLKKHELKPQLVRALAIYRQMKRLSSL